MAQRLHEANVVRSQNAPWLAPGVLRTRPRTGVSEQTLALAILSRSTVANALGRGQSELGVESGVPGRLVRVDVEAAGHVRQQLSQLHGYQAPLPPRACSKA